MSIYSNQMQVALRKERFEPIDLSVVEFDNEPASTPARTVASFLVEQNASNDWLYFTDQNGERMPLPDADESILRQGGFTFAGKRMGYYHKNDGTYTMEMLNKTAAYFVPTPAMAGTERPITFSAADYEIILAIEAAMIEEIDQVLAYELVTPNYPLLPARASKMARKAVKLGRRHEVSERIAHKATIRNSRPIFLGDGSNSAVQNVRPTQKPTKDSMGMDVLPVFGKVARVNPKAPEPPSVLTLEIQDPRSEAAKEESRMKAAESMTLPLFPEGEEKPTGDYVLAVKLLDSMFGWNCNEKSRHETKAAAIDAGNALMARYDSEGHEESLRFAVILNGRQVYEGGVHKPTKGPEKPSEAIERAFFEAETLEEALDTGYLEHVYDSVDMLGVVNPEPPKPTESRKKSTISPNHPEFLKHFDPVERGAPVLGAILRGDCPRCHSRPANEPSRFNSEGWCDHCNAPKGNGDGKVGDYLTREELSANAKAMNYRKRHECGVCGDEVPEDRIEPIAKKGEKQKSALCAECERAALNRVSPGTGPDAE